MKRSSRAARAPHFDISTATPDEILAEAERRTAARKQGRRFDVGSVIRASSAEMDADARNRESVLQAEIVRQYRAFGCVVYSLSQSRAAKLTPGIPDLYVLHRRCAVAWWHETKTAEGRHSPDQLEFAAFCGLCSVNYVTGGVQSAEDALVRYGVARRIGAFLQSTLSDETAA